MKNVLIKKITFLIIFAGAFVVGEKVKTMNYPTEEEVESFVRTFPRGFNPETDDPEHILGDAAIKKDSTVWKLSSFLYGSHQEQRLKGKIFMTSPSDNHTEKYSYEASYTSSDAREEWPLLLTFYASHHQK